MDPVTLYRLGQIRQQEILDEANQRRDAEAQNNPSLWTRLSAVISTRRSQIDDSDCPQPQRSSALA